MDTQTPVVAKKMLVVDDEAALANLWRRKFEKEGYQVDLASNGQEALEEMNRQQYDVILTDLYMPQKTGFDVLSAKAGTKNADTPVYVLTGTFKEGDIDSAKKLGAKEVFLKYRTSTQEVVKAVKSAG